jgi:glycosyltransferase involved in cell wall biosynthesis
VSYLRTIADPPVSQAPQRLRYRLNLIAPFYDEAGSLTALLDSIHDLSRRLAAFSIEIEAILVDDGSRDGGSDTVSAWARANKAGFDLRLIRLSRNFGKELALSAGLEAADGDAVVLMDADLQHPPALVEAFVEAWLNEGMDVVYAVRERPAAEGLLTRWARREFYRLIDGGSGSDHSPYAGDFRLMSRRAYEALRRFPERERLMKGLYGLIGFPTKAVPFTPPPRACGVSKFSGPKVWAMGMNSITSFSVLPLRLMVFAGLVLGLMAFAYGLWTVVEKLAFGIHVPGYPTVIVIMCALGAAQLIGLGVVGEYVGKVLIEVKQRPLYILESEQRFTGALLAAEPEGRAVGA